MNLVAKRISSISFCFILALLIVSPIQARENFTDQCGYPTARCCDTSVDPATAYGEAASAPGGSIISSVWGWLGKRMYTLVGEDNFGDSQCFASNPTTDASGQCICDGVPSQQNYLPISTLCNTYFPTGPGDIGKQHDACISCVMNKNGFYSFTCIPLSFTSFIKDWVLKTMIGFAGIFALLNIIYGAYQLQTSQGNQDKVKAARERVTASIVGLLMILFSVLLLKVIGVDILQLPGFSK
ncbi:MAG: hypothetical protein ACMG6E_06575 [Candidatus Roizmanbacteria bacterium]